MFYHRKVHDILVQFAIRVISFTTASGAQVYSRTKDDCVLVHRSNLLQLRGYHHTRFRKFYWRFPHQVKYRVI